MKHYEIRDLKKSLDELVQYVASRKITNPYLNYGLVRNSKILAKAIEPIDAATPTELKELETKMYQEGLAEYSKSLSKATTKSEKLSELDKQNKIFNLGFTAASQEERDIRNKLATEYASFLQLEDDTELYYLNFEGLTDLDLEIEFWATLDNFIKRT